MQDGATNCSQTLDGLIVQYTVDIYSLFSIYEQFSFQKEQRNTNMND